MDEVLGPESGGRFLLAGLLRCRRCREPVIVGGSAVISESQPLGYSFSNGPEYEPRTTTYTIRFVSPAPSLIDIPEDCPAQVKEPIAQAFGLYFLDPNAAGNRLRSAVEVLLTELGLSEPRNGKPSLDQRIEMLREEGSPQDRNLAERLKAVKWIGNAGSHGLSLREEDALDGFELLESVLRDRFVPAPETPGGIAKTVNEQKRPRTR